MEKDKVFWKNGSQFKASPTEAYEEILRIKKKNGGDVLPEDLVAAAKSKRNVLHGDFEWDDTVAGEEYRKHIARKILHSFVIVDSRLTTDRPQRVFETVLVRRAESPRPRYVYRLKEDIMADPGLRAEMVQRALKELITFRNKFKDLQELTVVIRAIDELMEQLV